MNVYIDPIIGNLQVQQQGSLKYIVHDCEIITEGYHDFHLVNGTLMGTRGSTVEVVVHL